MSLTFTPHQRSAALPQGATAIDPAALEAPPPPHIDLSEIVSFTPILDSEDRRQVAAPAAIAASSNAQAELIRSFIGQVVCRLTNQRSYRGGWAHGTRHGFGDYTFSNGDRFQGFWCEGKKHGFGVYIFNDLDRYEGEWEEDQIQGQGTYIYANGNSFLGQWIRNEKHGRGTMNFKNGDSYEGTWVANRIEGPGRLLLGNGKEKAGLFSFMNCT